MSTYAINYAIWNGATGAALEWYKRNGRVGMQTLLTHGFLEKAIAGLAASYLQQMNLPLMGTNLDANYIYNGLLGAVTAMYRHDKSKLQGAEEQILCSLISHRLASNFGMAFDNITSNFGFVNQMFQNSGGYVGATIPNQGQGIPSQNSGNNNPTI